MNTKPHLLHVSIIHWFIFPRYRYSTFDCSHLNLPCKFSVRLSLQDRLFSLLFSFAGFAGGSDGEELSSLLFFTYKDSFVGTIGLLVCFFFAYLCIYIPLAFPSFLSFSNPHILLVFCVFPLLALILHFLPFVLSFILSSVPLSFPFFIPLFLHSIFTSFLPFFPHILFPSIHLFLSTTFVVFPPPFPPSFRSFTSFLASLLTSILY